MRSTVFSYLFLPLFTCLSLSTTAAPTVEHPLPTVSVAGTAQGMEINVNTVDAATLEKELLGIGRAKAQAIITYRDTHGVFNSLDELLEVNGIGKALLDRNRDRLVVK
ncbi:ComEA family DNA-binding protein [Pseudomonas carassii]|uniref:ComEA family DNA-binding protein n=1 Tax=Pseudomonas carassii TaxID=3115855 RepID=A0ABU7HCA6_9PSED|nr:ComEA family DNA-binding protein [Pseudomonas sp. 137P]MEE1888745.1 ComEA family DNA-binding protein [Pseudomonas sp. 137P]